MQAQHLLVFHKTKKIFYQLI
uniref:Uncharacterized protein n=1 Tax=Salix viminalis TaxID=40686 RepID=A0A6N2ME90_SALVM